MQLAVSWIKKVGGGECHNYPTHSGKTATEDVITDAQNFNTAPKFGQNQEFLTPKFCIFG